MRFNLVGEHHHGWRISPIVLRRSTINSAWGFEKIKTVYIIFHDFIDL